MTTVEKLLVQIFERKNWIIDQVKQQTELYNQHLASKLLIDGITPPSWLWSPNASDSKELNKDELISKMLRPYAQPSVRCSIVPDTLYDSIVVAGDNEELSDGFLMENLAFHGGNNRQEDQAVLATSRENHAGCTPISVPQENVGVTSPEDQTDKRILNIYNAPDQSLARIQRSKSRQKALELRSSANTQVKSSSGHENISDLFSSRIRLSMSATEQIGMKDELPMAESCAVEHQNGNGLDMEAHVQSKEKEKNVSTGRITRSRSAKISVLVGQTSERCREDISSHVSKPRKRESVLSFDSKLCHATKSVTSSSAVCPQSCESWKSDGEETRCQSKEKKLDVYTGTITRSRSAKVPILVEGSSKLGQSLEGYRDDVTDHVSTARKTGSPLVIDSKQGDADKLLRSTSAVSSQICESRKLDTWNGLCNHNNSDVYPAEISGRKFSGQSQSCACDSSTVNDDNKRVHIPAMDTRDDLTHNSDDGSPLSFCPNLIDECRDHGEDDVVILVPTSGRSALLVNDSNVGQGLVMPSVAVINGVIESPNLCNDPETSNPANISEYNIFGSTVPSSSCKQKSATNDELEIALRDQTVPPCEVSNDVLDEQENPGLHDLGDHSASSSASDAKTTREPESLEEYLPSDCIAFLEPKKSNFNGIEDHHNLRSFVPNSRKRRLDKSPVKMNYSSSSPAILLDKGISRCDDQLSLDMQSKEKSEISSKEDEVQRDSFKFQEDPGSCADHELLMSKNSENNRDAENICENFIIQNEEDILQEKIVDVPDLQIHTSKHHEEQMDESLPESQIEKGGSSQKSKDMKLSFSRAPKSNSFSPFVSLNSVNEPNTKSRNCLMEKMHVENPNSLVLDKSTHLPSEECKIVCSLEDELSGKDAGSPITHGEDLPLERRFKSANLESWSQLKRRKIEYEQTNSPTTIPGVRVRKLHHVQRVPAGVNLNIEIEDSALMDMNNDLEILQEMDYKLAEKNECTTGAQTEEDTDNLNSEDLTISNIMLQRVESPQGVSGPQPRHHVFPSISNDLECIDVDESMPVFEGFTIDTQAETADLEFTADGIDFDKLALPRSTLERASFLAEICRSASMDTPLPHFSPSSEFQGNQYFFQSVPNGLLEHLDLSNLALHYNVDKQLQSGNGVANDMKGTFEKMSYVDCGPCPGPRYGWTARNEHSSPVGKLWERLSSHTGSSEKHSSSNPELTCFPIEEDPSTGEENQPEDETTSNDQEEIDSLSANRSNKRQPLKDLTNLGLNPYLSVSDKKEAPGVDNFIREIFIDAGTKDKVQQSPKSQCRNNIERKEKQTSYIGPTEEKKIQNLSIGVNRFKISKESINNSMNRTMLLGKNLKRQDRELFLKESTSSNIISNVSSFIPLVQQKQLAAACTGKRDVKVKALEAAEAAKRLEEKKANERRIRKEALKLERAKLEEKHLRHVELEKKKKEEERKKREADIVARKRLREEDERKEKDKKRMRVEARQRQREQEEKMRAEKAEKGKQRSKDEQMNKKKELYKETKNLNNGETARGDEVTLKETETRLTPMGSAMNYEECSTSVQFGDTGKAMQIVDKSPKNENLIVQKEKSYEISPYRSDDEDEESDGPRPKKYTPPWVSEIFVTQFLASQQAIDPSIIFPPESFSTTDEVVLPQKLQRKQGAA